MLPSASSSRKASIAYMKRGKATYRLPSGYPNLTTSVQSTSGTEIRNSWSWHSRHQYRQGATPAARAQDHWAWGAAHGAPCLSPLSQWPVAPLLVRLGT